MEQRTLRRRLSSSPSSPSSQIRRKIFNCIVDDTALLAGVKRSTRNGLRQWIKNGHIRLFVPLHALEQLNLQKGGGTRHAEDARETLEWLDEATSRYPDAVTLQGGDDTFEDWSEVEKFAVPRSLFSEYDHDLSSSPEERKAAGNRDKPLSERFDKAVQISGASGVPVVLQPLFSYLLWRIHQEIDRAAALESFIFLCNDPTKVELAKGFEVRCKRLEQLRDAIGREDKETKQRQPALHHISQSVSSLPDDTTSPTRLPPIAPAATSPPQTKIIDPDTFGRSPNSTYTSPQPSRGRGGRGSTRIRGRANTTASPKLGRADLVYKPAGGRDESTIDAGPEIDPNSFERPRGGHGGRGGRRLWTPG